ncbi:MAG: carbohydrate kinase [Deltaproteobacteria bacterium]|nr:carbohydrate kinase [Deltaproteobacteria bacterium]
MTKAYFLGVDAGTTSVKAVIFDEAGNEIRSASRPLAVSTPKPNFAEQDMEEVWLAFAAACGEVMGKSSDLLGSLKAMCVTGQGGGSWIIGQDDKPVRPACLWMDGRSKEIIEGWQKDGTYERLYQATGWDVYTGLAPSTILPWFMIHEPESLKKAKAVVYCKDWLRFRLTGELLMDETDLLAMTDPRTRRYSQQIWDLAGIASLTHLFPPIRPSWEPAGKVTEKAAALCGLPAGLMVACGSIDVSSTALGVGCVEEGDAASILGTAAIHLAVCRSPKFSKGYSLSQHCVPGAWLGNCMAMMAASCLDWFEGRLGAEEKLEAEKAGLGPYDLINQKVASAPLGAGGVIFLPYLQGERAPFVKPEARGDFYGLGLWTKREDILRSIFEGVALATAHNHQSLSIGASFDEFWLAGGGAASPVWAQIVADCVGKRVKVPKGREFGARGAAINAAVAAGFFKSHQEAVKAMVEPERRYAPNERNHARYKELLSIYIDLGKSLMPFWERSYKWVAEADSSGRGPEGDG